jgi:hypothetical protein
MVNKNNIFSIKRLLLLIKRQVFGNITGLIIAFASFGGMLLVVSVLTGFFNPEGIRGLWPLYFVALFMGGYVFSSNIFSELNSPQRSITFLTLPVSNLERLAMAWLLTAIMYSIFALTGIALVFLLTHLIVGIPLAAESFSATWTWDGLNTVLIYVITQSVFLFGAIYFRRLNFFKTILSIFVIQSVLGLIVTIAFFLIFGTFNFESYIGIQKTSLSSGLENFFRETLPDIMEFAFYYLMIPFFLILTWFGIKERQV